MAERGVFVVFEGGDRVGKSTQVRALAKALRLTGIDHIVTFEPGDTDAGAVIRGLLLDPESDLDDRCESLLYAADKAQHVSKVIVPALRSGRVVVCDRYVDSMLAYQGAGRNLDPDELAQLAEWATGGIHPDLTIVLDIDPAKAVSKARNLDRLEQAGTDFHKRVRQRLLDFASVDPDRYLVLPALSSVRGTAATIRRAVEKLLKRPLEVPDLREPGTRRG